jgi:TonB-dependent receptor
MSRLSFVRFARFAFVAAALVGAAPLAAQGVVTGLVTDPSGRPLSGVLVTVEGTTIRAASERGQYRVVNVPAGSRTLTFRYIGYQPVTRQVTVTADQVTTLDVQLTEAVATLQAVEVRAQVAGQASALNQQRTSANITTVIDNELVGRLPDPNMAEALARVPGVAMVRDQGEGRFVQIRGSAPNLNSLSLNGLRVSTPEQNSRQLPMDIIPSDQAGQIQVSKTLTPDLDADAIGGNVNIVTRTARPGQRIANLTMAGGQNQLGGGALVNLGGNFGQRFGPDDRFGLMVGGTYYRNDRASQNFEGDWCSQTRNCGAPTDPSYTSLDVPNLWELRDYPQINRLRQGLNATLDYALANGGKVFLRGTFNQFSDDEIRFRTRFRFRDGSGSRFTIVTPDSGTTTGSRIDRDVRLRKVTQDIYTAQFGSEHVFGSGKALDWAVGTSRARENRPGVLTMAFRMDTARSLAYNFADPDRPRVYMVTGLFDAPGEYLFNSLVREVRVTRDDDLSGKLNYSMPITVGSASGTLKAGVSARLKDRGNALNQTAFTNALGANSLGATRQTLFRALVSDPRPRSVFDGDYSMGRHLDPALVQTFIGANPGAFTVNQLNTATASAGGTYDVGEDVYAGYVMATLDYGNVQVVPGVRYEATRVNNTAKAVSIANNVATIRDTTASASYGNVFPSVNATWRLDELTNVKAAVTTSLVRPQFRDMVPYVNVQAGQQTASIGNPALKATTATAGDLMFERYFRSVGFVGAGAFYKRLSDFTYETARPRTDADGDLGPDAQQVLQIVNGGTATLYGFEIAWQQTLGFLGGPFRYLGINANYTYTQSDAEIPGRGREGETTPLPEQTGNAGNLGLFLDKGRLSLRVGANYNGDFVSTINAITPEADTRTRSRLQVDASGSYTVRPGVKVFGEFINLTNTPLRAYVGNRLNRGGGGDDPSFEFYKAWGMMGVRIER